MSQVISFRLDPDTFKKFVNVKRKCIYLAAERNDAVQQKVLDFMSYSTFAKVVFLAGLDHIESDLNRGGTTTPPMGAK